MSFPLAPFDSNGRALAIGVDVIIPRLPEWLLSDLPHEELTLLRTTEGTIMRILAIDKFGYVWFGKNNEGQWFCLRPEDVTVVTPK